MEKKTVKYPIGNFLTAFLIFLLVGCQQEFQDTAFPYTVEDIPTPEGLTAEVAAIDVLKDGRLVAAFMRGEIMIYDPSNKSWTLFASGLHEPLGLLAVSEKEIMVMQLAELTRIVDTDGDALADQYETLYDGFGMTGNYHEFAYGPVKDSKGNLFVALNSSSSGGGVSDELRGEQDSLGKSAKRAMFSTVPYRGWVMKIAPDGKISPYAMGFRSPNGLVMSKNDELYLTDNQGDWVGSSCLYQVQQGKFYGHPASLIWKEGWNKGNPFELPIDSLEQMREKPAVIFPHDVIANSPSQPVLIEDHKELKAFQGQYLVGEMNQGRLVRIILDQTQDGITQGSVTPFLDGHGLRKGNNRLAFGPDGSLWIGQSDHGWLGDRGIQRLHFSGGVPFDIQSMNLNKNGFSLSFTRVLQTSNGEDLLDKIKIKKYRYHYHDKYGSPQVDVQNVTVKKVDLSLDKKKVDLHLGEMTQGFVYELTLDSVFSKNNRDTMNQKVIAYTLKKKK